MLYIGYFGFTEDMTSGAAEDTHGAFTCVAAATSPEAASATFRRLIRLARQEHDLFDGPCEIFLHNIVEVKRLPRRGLILNYEMFMQPATAALGCAVPLPTRSTATYGWKPDDATDDETLHPFLAFTEHKSHDQAERARVKRSDLRFTRAKTKTLERVGEALLMLHQLEHFFAHAWLLEVGGGRTVTLADVSVLVQRRQRLTLGQMITRVRQTHAIDTRVEDLLQRLVANRNLLVHGLFYTSEYSFFSKSGQKKLQRFLDHFERDARAALPVISEPYFASSDFLAFWTDHADQPFHLAFREWKNETPFAYFAAFTPVPSGA